jgi:ABC-type nitrate/sulfonate/bicarbonate transport system substrate-binding protein
MATNGSKVLTFTTLILLLALIATRETRAAAARPLRIAFLFTSGTMASLWMAKESGAFAKEGSRWR